MCEQIDPAAWKPLMDEGMVSTISTDQERAGGHWGQAGGQEVSTDAEALPRKAGSL